MNGTRTFAQNSSRGGTVTSVGKSANKFVKSGQRLAESKRQKEKREMGRI